MPRKSSRIIYYMNDFLDSGIAYSYFKEAIPDA